MKFRDSFSMRTCITVKILRSCTYSVFHVLCQQKPWCTSIIKRIYWERKVLCIINQIILICHRRKKNYFFASLCRINNIKFMLIFHQSIFCYAITFRKTVRRKTMFVEYLLRNSKYKLKLLLFLVNHFLHIQKIT